METFETDGIIEALATLAKRIQTLTESIESAKFVPLIRKEQRQQDMEAILFTMKQALQSLEIRTSAELPKDAKEALIDFNTNLKSLKRRPLFDGKRSRWLSISSLIVILVSVTFFLYAQYETNWSRDAYAKRAYYVSIEMGLDEPEKAYSYVQNMWNKERRLVKAKVKSCEEEIKKNTVDSK